MMIEKFYHMVQLSFNYKRNLNSLWQKLLNCKLFRILKVRSDYRNIQREIDGDLNYKKLMDFGSVVGNARALGIKFEERMDNDDKVNIVFGHDKDLSTSTSGTFCVYSAINEAVESKVEIETSCFSINDAEIKTKIAVTKDNKTLVMTIMSSSDNMKTLTQTSIMSQDEIDSYNHQLIYSEAVLKSIMSMYLTDIMEFMIDKIYRE